MRHANIMAISLVCGLILSAGMPGYIRADGPVRLTVVYTGNIDGKLRGCSCPGDPFGGLVERATLIGDIRDRAGGPFLLLDAGNIAGLFGDYDLKVVDVSGSRIARVRVQEAPAEAAASA